LNITAKVDYAMRALLEMAEQDRPTSGEALAERQKISPRFLFSILGDLRRAGLITNQRGPDGGYRLAARPEDITPADVIRALDGPLAEVRNLSPEAAHYSGSAQYLQHLWVATRASLRSVLDVVTLSDLLKGDFPPSVAGLLESPSAWQPEHAAFGSRNW